MRATLRTGLYQIRDETEAMSDRAAERERRRAIGEARAAEAKERAVEA